MARGPALRTCRSCQPRGGPGTDKDAHLAGTWAQEDPARGSWAAGPSWARVLQPELRNSRGTGGADPLAHPGLCPLPPTALPVVCWGTQRTAARRGFGARGLFPSKFSKFSSCT